MKSNDIKKTVTLSEKRKFRAAGYLIHRGVLVVLSENFFGKSFVLKHSGTILGRAPDSDITLKDPMISKVHCSVSFDEEGKFFIEDLDSKNKTIVNKKKLKKKTQLFYGDRIVIGNTILRFFLEEKIQKS
jgi:pSer/pThr/pTyr-binding forkhead associated (FHA) protein